MAPEITLAALVLLALLTGLLVYDISRNRRSRRLLVAEVVVFAVGGTLIVFPEIARILARSVGIGRGVDFVLYPLVIWLVRESLLSRRRRHEDEERMTELVRALAVIQADVPTGQGLVAGVGVGEVEGQSSGRSASTTT